FQSNPRLPDGVRFSSESSPHELIFYGTKLFRFLEGNQLQPLGSCRNTSFFSGQKRVPRPTVSTGITEIPIIRIGNNLQGTICSKNERRRMYIVRTNWRQYHNISQ